MTAFFKCHMILSMVNVLIVKLAYIRLTTTSDSLYNTCVSVIKIKRMCELMTDTV